MKRMIIIALAALAGFLFYSCEKEEPVPEVKPTTYTLKNELTGATEEAKVKLDLIAFEYNEENEKIANNDYDQAVTGGSRTFTANPRSMKVKVHVRMYAPDNSITPVNKWVQQVYYLEPEGNIDIVFGDTTKLGSQEP